MIRTIAAALVGAHGLIHLIGFAVAWGLLQASGQANVWPDGAWVLTTRIDVPVLSGSPDAGVGRAWIIGLAWLAVGVGFVVAATALEQARPWAVPLTGGLAIASAILCALWLPDAATGILLDGGILVAAGYVLARARWTVVL